MNYFDRYKAVNTPYSTEHSGHVVQYSAESAARQFFASPTLTDVRINGEDAKSVVSVYSKDFFDRTFLFEPYSIYAKVGNYIEHREHIYLTLKSNDNDIYPNMHAKLCNEDFLVPVETRKVIVQGHRNSTIKEEVVTEAVPIVVDVKGYSISDNAVLPLAEGRVIIYMQYQEKYAENVKLNYEFELFQDTYKISDIQLDKVVNGTGYMVLSAQKVSEFDEK